MRIIPALVSLSITIILIILLSLPWGAIPPLGKFLSPQHGFWLNAEPTNKDYSEEFQFPQLEGKVEVHFDDRLVPHVFAEKENDAWFVQGFLHARFRLWQMEFQTMVAAGRLSEVLGAGDDSVYLNNDRNMRRLGMTYGAENSLQEMEKDPDTKAQLDAYTAGINAYITRLSNAELPFEYRLLNYEPELWTNLKTALFLKFMSYDLTGEENDLEYTNAKAVLTRAAFEQMYPITQDSLDPIVPKGTNLFAAMAKPEIPALADSLYFNWVDSIASQDIKPDRDNGSNNWAVNGSKTKSGRPILSNDPHLGINLPSLWYEIQITTPGFSTYGASFPGSPSVIIGFNDSIAWGVTNAMRDVRDYYQIEFRDNSQMEYRFENGWRKAELRVEEYRIRGKGSFRDTVRYTVFGPVMYDQTFSGTGRRDGKTLAVKWKAHEASNELRSFRLLNKAKNYSDYLNAIEGFVCPGQNFVFASKSNEIAIWQQAGFPAKWRRQGDFIMPGYDSSFMWKGDIPQEQNPHLINPGRGFVSSANQLPVDSSYPYYIGGSHHLYRGLIINRYLEQMNGIGPEEMKNLQNENYNVFAEMALPILLENIERANLTEIEKRYFGIVNGWNKRNDPAEKGVAVFQSWFDQLKIEVWGDEMQKIPEPRAWPEESTLVEAIKANPDFPFIDNINTPQRETLRQLVTVAFRKVVPALAEAERDGKLEWATYKNTGVRHLLRIPQLSRLNLITGGGIHIINATKQFHAPSWKMVVHLTDEIEAYGIYPGGQSGNPGSKYYDISVDDWASGKFYELWFMKKGDHSRRIRHTMIFTGNA